MVLRVDLVLDAQVAKLLDNFAWRKGCRCEGGWQSRTKELQQAQALPVQVVGSVRFRHLQPQCTADASPELCKSAPLLLRRIPCCHIHESGPVRRQQRYLQLLVVPESGTIGLQQMGGEGLEHVRVAQPPEHRHVKEAQAASGIPVVRHFLLGLNRVQERQGQEGLRGPLQVGHLGSSASALAFLAAALGHLGRDVLMEGCEEALRCDKLQDLIFSHEAPHVDRLLELLLLRAYCWVDRLLSVVCRLQDQLAVDEHRRDGHAQGGHILRCVRNGAAGLRAAPSDSGVPSSLGPSFLLQWLCRIHPELPHPGHRSVRVGQALMRLVSDGSRALGPLRQGFQVESGSLRRFLQEHGVTHGDDPRGPAALSRRRGGDTALWKPVWPLAERLLVPVRCRLRTCPGEHHEVQGHRQWRLSEELLGLHQVRHLCRIEDEDYMVERQTHRS
mmetsp:Transcript_28126/g.63513  ORF Transcript_28126/g.63513 Transcript_28126/m.63513 type:complete len:444 (-) Transcript_28126:467-1798(-)